MCGTTKAEQSILASSPAYVQSKFEERELKFKAVQVKCTHFVCPHPYSVFAQCPQCCLLSVRSVSGNKTQTLPIKEKGKPMRYGSRGYGICVALHSLKYLYHYNKAGQRGHFPSNCHPSPPGSNSKGQYCL